MAGLFTLATASTITYERRETANETRGEVLVALSVSVGTISGDYYKLEGLEDAYQEV